ncbi:hypothetical protein GLYMA_19G030300v4 [Glycine max]|uniref:Uncharacterized protein n=2 Tax=Glycine subgen. Soja TaxID=1462606 RepID=K7MW88_SOYBN|nr:uncharacterized protein LOC102661247 [Glycine max]KAH1076192.1 hypothetical protein GYH30_051886 [Glycine max]KHN48826.1 hypothetical protein glysoja_030596 [Glycine soja]KRG93648.1 hypothetical protein GLYMA_19G030300v4 [Glycine max]RZB46233.1 hypothetical protein D0Y65_050306 [Glycine soja]|eukprot:XP_006604982.1 uncharacterized protein LOC102661247 [Glycine max]
MAFLNYENKKGSGKKLKVHFDLPEDDDFPNHRHSSSSVSSESSLDSDDTDNDNSINNVDSKYGLYGSPVWSFQGGSVTQSPPVQFMNSPGYDPNRIPSSVFNKPTSPMEWSVASNESLFSIQLGNSSFSRDYAFAFNNKSGELPRTSDLPNMPATLPSVQEVPAKEKNVDMERQSVSSDSSSETADSIRGHDHDKTSHESAGSVVDLKKTENSEEIGTDEVVLDKYPDDHSKEAKIPNGEAKNYASVSYRSVESNMSTRSFQFPILTAEGGRTSSSTVESEKQEQQPEKPQQPPSPKTEKAPKKSGKSWCFCFSCSPCF